MRLNEIKTKYELKNVIHSVDGEGMSKIAELLYQKAPTAVKLLQENKFFYRGISKSRDDFFIQEPINDRKPANSRPDTQKLVDQCLLQQGFKALRSNSFFCSSDPVAVLYYGVRYVVFPFDPFDYTWSSVIHDMYTAMTPMEVEQLQKDFDKNPSKASEMFVYNFGFHNSDQLLRALRTNHEIYVHGTCAFVHNAILPKLKVALGS